MKATHILAGIALWMVMTAHGEAGTYVVAPAGSDGASGSMAAPWKTLARGVSALYPGDTLLVRAGVYDEKLAPSRSGVQGSPIVIQSYPGEYVEIRGANDNDMSVAVVPVGYLVIEGFTFRNQDYFDIPFDRSYWIQLTGAHITFRRNRVLADGRPFYNHDTLHATSRAIVVSGRSVLIEECLVRGQAFGIVVDGPAPRFVTLRKDTVFATYQNNVDITATVDGSTGFHGTLIEQCVLDTSFIEDNIQFEVNYAQPTTTAYNRGTIIRGCRMGNAAENGIDLKGAAYVVIDGNLIYGSAGNDDGPVGGNDTRGGSAIEVNANNPGSNIIVRNNVIWDNCHGAVLAEGDHYYNNVFLNNRRTWEGSSRSTASSFGVQVFTLTAQPRVYVNNIIAAQPNRAVLDWRMDNGARFTQDHNLYFDPTGPVSFSHRLGGTVALVVGLPAWKNTLASSSSYAYLDGKDAHSLEADPQFLNVPAYPEGYLPSLNFQTSPTSPARGAGRNVAAATAGGVMSTNVLVNDAGAFCDGFGITAGDEVRINGGSPVRIVGVDYAANVLTIDVPETWPAGAGVHTRFSGNAPDIGASENGTGASSPLAQGTGVLRFSTSHRQVFDNTTVADSLHLLLQGSSLKALQFRLVTAGRTILRRIARGVHLPERDWWFFSSMKRGAVQEDGSVADTCSVVILGAGTASLPAGTYENLAVFSYDVVNTPSATPVTTTFRLIDVVGALAEGSNAGTVAGGAQTVSIRNGVSAGDVNGDDRVDILDVVLVVDHILLAALLPPDQLLRADIAPWPGGDGVVDARDLAVLLDIVLVRAYPDGTRPYFLPVNSIPDHLEKLSERITGLHNVVRMSFNGGRVRIRLRNTVPVRGVQWRIQGLSTDSTSRTTSTAFESNHWVSDSLGMRGLSYSSQAGTLSPGDWLIGDFAATGRSAVDPLHAEVSVVCADPNRIEQTVVQIDNEENTGFPVGFHLDQNFPNPFNPVTVIRFALPEPAHTRLTVYTLLGEEVAMLLNEPLNAGAHGVSFDAQGLSSGVYFYRMEAGRNIATKKMLLVH